MSMLVNTGMAMAKKPTKNITPAATHCVVSTLRYPSWLYQRTSVYRLVNMKNAIASTAMIAMAIAMTVRDLRAGFGAPEFCALGFCAEEDVTLGPLELAVDVS